MANGTNQSQPSSASFSDAITQQIGYIILGFVGFALSGSISISLLFKGIELRQGQRHILLTTMEIANFSLNFTHFLAGCFRLKYVLTNEYVSHVSTWQCMRRVYPPLFVFTLQFVPMALFANALERFLAVNFATAYYQNVKTRHQTYAVLFIVGYCTLATIVAYICSYTSDQSPVWPYNCITGNAVGHSYNVYYYSVVFVFTILSAPASLATVIALIRQRKVLPSSTGSIVPSTYAKKQASLTKALLLATVVVFVLMCPPMIANFMTSALGLGSVQWVQDIVPYASFIIISHSIFGDVILLTMNRQVRNSMRNLFRMSDVSHT